MLNDIEDLDYEPDGFDEEQLLQEDDQAEPTEQRYFMLIIVLHSLLNSWLVEVSANNWLI